MARNKISDMRDHLFEAMERLKTNEIDVKAAKAMAEIGSVLVESAKVELQMMKQMGMTNTPTEFMRQQQMLQPAAAAALPLPEEDPLVRYGRQGKNYYARVLRRDRDGDVHVTLVPVSFHSLKQNIGPLVDQLSSYPSMDKLEETMLLKPAYL